MNFFGGGDLYFVSCKTSVTSWNNNNHPSIKCVLLLFLELPSLESTV